MKRDTDMVRDILLEVEASEAPELARPPVFQGRSAIEVNYHLGLLKEAGYLRTVETRFVSHPVASHLQISLTWTGHEFLDTVRDPEIWSTTKAGASKVGAWTIGLLADLAKAAMTAKATSLGLL